MQNGAQSDKVNAQRLNEPLLTNKDALFSVAWLDVCIVK